MSLCNRDAGWIEFFKLKDVIFFGSYADVCSFGLFGGFLFLSP